MRERSITTGTGSPARSIRTRSRRETLQPPGTASRGRIFLISLIFFLGPGTLEVRAGDPPDSGPEDPVLVRIENGPGLREAYVRDAIRALGPLQRASLSVRPMLESFLRDLAGLRLMAEGVRADRRMEGDVAPDRPRFEQDHSLTQELIQAEIDRLPPPGEEELHRSYRENLKFFQEAPQIRFRQILVSRRSLAEEIAGLLAGGASFEELARKHSRHPSAKQGGEMGWVGEDRLEPELLAGLRPLGPGETGPIIETPFGLHIVEVQGREEGGVAPFDRVRGTILKRLDLKRRQEVSERLLKQERNLGSRVIEVDLEAIEVLLAEFDIHMQAPDSEEESAASGEPEESVLFPTTGERSAP